MRGGREYWIRALVGEVDVDEGSDGLDVVRGLGVGVEVALARLIFGVPFEYVKLDVVGMQRSALEV